MNAEQAVVDRNGGPLSRPVHVLYVIDTLEVGGAEQSLLNFCRHRDPHVVQMSVCAIYPGDALRSAFEATDTHVVQLDVNAKYGFARAISRVKQQIRALRPDVVHTTLFRANQVGRVAAWLSGVPAVTSFVNTPYDRTRTDDNPHISVPKLRALQLLDYATAKLARGFHAVSGAVRDANCRDLAVAPERVTVVHRGRDSRSFEEQDTTELRRELELADDAHVVLNVGRLVDQKGQEFLLRAMRQVRESVPGAVLLIAGEGSLREYLARVAETEGVADAVRFLGYRNDTQRLLALAHCFAFPSLYEGMPGSVVEAMMAHCPVVASQIPVIEEVVTHEASGVLVPPKSPQDLAAAIVRVLADRELAASLADNAQQIARQRFDIRFVAQQMSDFYVRVAARQPG